MRYRVMRFFWLIACLCGLIFVAGTAFNCSMQVKEDIRQQKEKAAKEKAEKKQ